MPPGVIIFDDDVRNYVQPSTRQGQFMRVAHAVEKAELGTRTDFAKPFIHFQQFHRRRGIVAVLSDFYEQPDVVIQHRSAASATVATIWCCSTSSIRRRFGPR